MKFDNVVLTKDSKITPRKNDEDSLKKSEERKKRIKEYDGLTFNQITIKYAEKMLCKKISEENIYEVLS